MSRVPVGASQAASEQRPHKLSYHLGAKGDAAEKVPAHTMLPKACGFLVSLAAGR